MWHGFAVLTVILDRNEVDEEMPISTAGLLENEDDPILDTVRLAVREAIHRLFPQANDADDHTISEVARIAARRAFRALIDKRPITRVHLVRLD